MTRSRTSLIFASHLVAAGVGGWLAFTATGDNSATVIPGTRRPERAPDRTLAEASARGRTTPASVAQWHGTEYARAWKAVRYAKLSRDDRHRVQRSLLQQWAEVDLAAAIDAALGEEWDSENGEYYDPAGPLVAVFADAFKKDPAAAWDMIRARQFGLGTGLVRNVWIDAAGKSDPLFLAGCLGQLSWRDRDRALSACQRGDAEQREKIFAILSRLPADVVSTKDLLRFATIPEATADPAALREQILAQASDNPRLAEVRAAMLGSLLATLSPDEIASQLTALPDNLRTAALWAAFQNSPASNQSLALVNQLIRQEAWAKVEDQQVVRHLNQLARSDGGALEVATWATGLPVRGETRELFHRSVETYLRDHAPEAKTWIASLPPGEWRDRAYAEYSQQALGSHHDPAASLWALDRIDDKAFQKTATSWRAEWLKRLGIDGP